MPSTLDTEVSVGYDNFSISIAPISASKVTKAEVRARKADESVVYDGVFGENTLLVYTPMISGLKEDIVLAKYVPSATFSFTLKTNGLHIVEENGKYYLAQSEKSEPIFALGDVVAYDAVGKPSMGTMTVKTVKDGAEYVVTLEVDEEFLTDTTTVYPVTIDPSITISDNTNGAGAIEDAPIYQGYPDTNFGSYLFNPVGTPSADFGVGRTLVRLTGLVNSNEYATTSADQITSVIFKVREGSGGGSQYVGIYPMIAITGWKENTVTRNSMPMYMAAAHYGGTLYGGAESEFNITNLVKAWKQGTYPADGEFIMISSDETVNRNFLSSEYSTASYRPYVVMTYEVAIRFNSLGATVNEGGTVALSVTTTPSGQAVTWSTSDSGIATVDSNGVVKGEMAGSAIITATTIDANGVPHQASCMVYVTFPDGVYYVINQNSNYYLTTNGNITGTPRAYQDSRFSSSAPELTRIRQMWKIKHIGNGLYSVRPYNKLDMGLNVENDNNGQIYDNVNITDIGTTDSISGVAQSSRWRITNAFGGYIFENAATNTYMQIQTSSTETGASVITNFFGMNNNCFWNLERVSSPPEGVYLYDVAENAVTNTFTRAIDVGTTKGLSDFGLIAVAYSAANISQSFNWSTSDTGVATISASGLVTGISDGKATITATVNRGNNYYHTTYTICVGFPDMFKNFINTNNIIADNLDLTDDGLFLTTTPVSVILKNNGIHNLPKNLNNTESVIVENYYDDWYVYAIKDASTVVYGLYKMREEENDNDDNNDPGVTISFVEFDGELFMDCCLYYESEEMNYELYQALTRTVGPDEYLHNDKLVNYFNDTLSDGAYLIAEKAVQFFASCFSTNVITAPQKLTDMFEEYEMLLNNPSPDEEDLKWCRRVPDALAVINANAKIDSGNSELEIFSEVSGVNETYYTITVQDKNNLTTHEKHAILACFTGNVTFNSFAAEVEFHADATENIYSIIGYSSAIRADMAIGETYKRGFLEPYYELDSELVCGQIAAHGEY